MIRKLRARPLSSWEYGDRSRTLRQGMSELASLAASARGVSPHAVPNIGDHALADQFAVLIQDADDAGVPTEELAQLVARISSSLGLSESLGLSGPSDFAGRSC